MIMVPSMSVARRLSYFTKHLDTTNLNLLIKAYNVLICKRPLTKPEMHRFNSLKAEMEKRAGVVTND